jgi:hypothetical protein
MEDDVRDGVVSAVTEAISVKNVRVVVAKPSRAPDSLSIHSHDSLGSRSSLRRLSTVPIPRKGGKDFAVSGSPIVSTIPIPRKGGKDYAALHQPVVIPKMTPQSSRATDIEAASLHSEKSGGSGGKSRGSGTTNNSGSATSKATAARAARLVKKPIKESTYESHNEIEALLREIEEEEAIDESLGALKDKNPEVPITTKRTSKTIVSEV